MERLKPSIFFVVLIAVLAIFAGAVKADFVMTLSVRNEDSDRRVRELWLSLPDKYQSFKLYPVIIVLHGAFSDYYQMQQITGFDELSDKQGFMVAYHNGMGRIPKDTEMTWNAGKCCGIAAREDTTDVENIDNLINILIKNYRADPKRIYLVGHSNGAMMAYRYACEHPERVAAIAVNAGIYASNKCKETPRAVPILHLHGLEDKCMPFEGGDKCGQCFIDHFGSNLGGPVLHKCLPVEATLQKIAETNQCNPVAEDRGQIGHMSCKAWMNCAGGSDVSLCTLDGNGHNWPGHESQDCKRFPKSKACREWHRDMGPVSYDIDATKFIWDYLKEYSLP